MVEHKWHKIYKYAEHNGGRAFSRPIYYPIYTPPLHAAKARYKNFFFQHQLQWKQQSLRDEFFAQAAFVI